jgi:hypothetical protein
MSAAQFSIQLELRCSFWWLCIRRAYSLCLAVVIFIIEWPLAGQISLLSVLILTVLYVETRPQQAIKLRLEPKGRLSVFSHKDSLWQEAEQVRADLVHPCLTAFSAKFPQGKVCNWMVLADSCTPEDFRHLRVWLNWESTRQNPEHITLIS